MHFGEVLLVSYLLYIQLINYLNHPKQFNKPAMIDVDAILTSRSFTQILKDSSHSPSSFKDLVASSSLPKEIKTSIANLNQEELLEILSIQEKMNPVDSQHYNPAGFMVF